MPRNQPTRLPPAELQSLLVHWTMVADGARMPRKEDFRVRSLAAWRDNVAIISPAAYGDPRRYHFRLVGAALHERFGRDMMLKNLCDVDGVLRGPLRILLMGARMNCAPTIARAEVAGARAEVTNVTWCDMALPLYEGEMPGGWIIFASYVEKDAVTFPPPFTGEDARSSRAGGGCVAV